MSRAHEHRWLPRLLVFVLGLLAGLVVLADDIADWWALRTALQDELQGELQAELQGQSMAALVRAASDALPAVPSSTSSAVSLGLPAPPNALDWLPVLQAHGLRLQSLQHNPERAQGTSAAGSGGSGTAALSLTLQGDWRDWLALEQQAPALLAGWLPQSWQVQALGPPAAPGQVQLQWQLRWSGVTTAAARAESDTVTRADSAADARPAEARRAAATGAEVFSAAAALAESAVPPVVPRAPALASTPWRLLGVWQQAGTAHAIVQGSGQWHALSPGQSLGHSALRVQRIEGGQVWLSQGQPPHGARPWALGTTP